MGISHLGKLVVWSERISALGSFMNRQRMQSIYQGMGGPRYKGTKKQLYCPTCIFLII